MSIMPKLLASAPLKLRRASAQSIALVSLLSVSGLACGGFAIISMNHWLVAVGLASHVYANYTQRSPQFFALGTMALGLAIFSLLFINFKLLATQGFSIDVLYFTATAVGFRLGLGFVHFLYDRWLYKFSSPEVRATIGKDMFAAVPGGFKEALAAVPVV